MSGRTVSSHAGSPPNGGRNGLDQLQGWVGRIPQGCEFLERSEPVSEVERSRGVVAGIGTSRAQCLHLQELETVRRQPGLKVTKHCGTHATAMVGGFDGHQAHVGRVRAVLLTMVMPTSSPSTAAITDG